MDKNDRRLVRVGISFDLLLDMIRVGWKTPEGYIVECIKGIPPDTVFIDCYTDWAYKTAYFVFFHPSFEIAEVGALLPEIPIEHQMTKAEKRNEET